MTHCRLILSLGLTALLASCGGGSGGGNELILAPPETPAPPTYVTKDYTISMSEASVKRISNGDAVDVDTSGIEGSGTVVVSQ
jgi:hypothetical protein